MKKALLVFLFSAISAGTTAASDFSIVGGYGPTSNLKLQDVSLSLKGMSLFGVRFEKDFLGFLGFENSFLFAGNVLSVANLDLSGENGICYTTNLVANLAFSENFVPNVVAGVGFLSRFGESFPNVGSSFLTNWGGGVKLRRLIGPAGVRIDYRRLRMHNVEDASVVSNEVSGGILFTF